MTEREVAQAEPSVPEQDPFFLRLAAGPLADHDVRPSQALLPARRRDDGLAEVGLEATRECLPTLGPARMHPNLREVEHSVEQAYVPVRRAACSDVPEHA